MDYMAMNYQTPNRFSESESDDIPLKSNNLPDKYLGSVKLLLYLSKGIK